MRRRSARQRQPSPGRETHGAVGLRAHRAEGRLWSWPASSRRRPWPRRCRSVPGRTRASSRARDRLALPARTLAQDVLDVMAPSVAPSPGRCSRRLARGRRRSVAALGCELAMAPLGLGPRHTSTAGRHHGRGTVSCGRQRGGWAPRPCGSVLLGAHGRRTPARPALGAGGRPRRPAPVDPRGPGTSAVIERARRSGTDGGVEAAGDVPTLGDSPPEVASSPSSTAPAGSSGGRPSRCADSPPAQPPVPGSRWQSSRTRRSRPEQASSSVRCGLGPCNGSRP